MQRFTRSECRAQFARDRQCLFFVGFGILSVGDEIFIAHAGVLTDGQDLNGCCGRDNHNATAPPTTAPSRRSGGHSTAAGQPTAQSTRGQRQGAEHKAFLRGHAQHLGGGHAAVGQVGRQGAVDRVFGDVLAQGAVFRAAKQACVLGLDVCLVIVFQDEFGRVIVVQRDVQVFAHALGAHNVGGTFEHRVGDFITRTTHGLDAHGWGLPGHGFGDFNQTRGGFVTGVDEQLNGVGHGWAFCSVVDRLSQGKRTSMSTRRFGALQAMVLGDAFLPQFFTTGAVEPLPVLLIEPGAKPV